VNLRLPRARRVPAHAKQARGTGDPLGAVLGTVWALNSLTCVALLPLLVHENGAQQPLHIGPAASSPDLVSPDTAAAQRH
jgi:hypothetical protein